MGTQRLISDIIAEEVREHDQALRGAGFDADEVRAAMVRDFHRLLVEEIFKQYGSSLVGQLVTPR